MFHVLSCAPEEPGCQVQTFTETLINALGTITHCGDGMLTRLRELERTYRQSGSATDLSAQKALLNQCVAELCACAHPVENALSQAAAAETPVPKPIQRIPMSAMPINGKPLTPTPANVAIRNKLQSLPASAPKVVPLHESSAKPAEDENGLGNRAAAEQAFRGAVHDPAIQVAVFSIQRLELISERFGAQAVDQLVRRFLEEIRTMGRAGDHFYRWSAECVVGFFVRTTPVVELRTELNAAETARGGVLVQLQGRSALIPIHTATMVFVPSQEPDYESAVRKLELFANPTLPAAASSRSLRRSFSSVPRV
jgi:hypothetical protein